MLKWKVLKNIILKIWIAKQREVSFLCCFKTVKININISLDKMHILIAKKIYNYSLNVTLALNRRKGKVNNVNASLNRKTEKHIMHR